MTSSSVSSSFAAAAMQDAVLVALQSDQTLNCLAAGIYDEAPMSASYPHVSFGDTNEQSEDTKSHRGRRVSFDVLVTSQDLGQKRAKEIMAAVDGVLHGAALAVDGWDLITLTLVTARVTSQAKGPGDRASLTEGRMTYRALLFKH